MSTVKSNIETSQTADLFNVGDLAYYVSKDWEEVVIVTSKPNKQGNFKGVVLYCMNDLADNIGETTSCHIDNYTKFKGKLTLEQ
jgi:hypothetical protein